MTVNRYTSCTGNGVKKEKMICIDGKRENYRKYFEWCMDSMVQSYFEGITGKGFCNNETSPDCVLIKSGNFCYLSGYPTDLKEITKFIDSSDDKITIIPQHNELIPALESAYSGITQKIRYMMDKPKNGFDKNVLNNIISNINNISNAQIVAAKEKEYELMKKCEWENSFVWCFKDCDDFIKNGLAFVIYINNELAAAASSFGYYSKGYELIIATSPKFRGLGLAQICAAKFLLSCIEKNKKLHWDAANKTSVHIAEKLGYELAFEYTSLSLKKDK